MSEKIVQQPTATERQAKFSELPTAEVERSTFDMSHPWKGTMQATALVPCLVQEILPGDTMDIKSTAFMRLATPLKPIMDSLTADIHYFFVPNRIIWDNWVNFMGERDHPDDDPTEITVPQVQTGLDVDTYSGSLMDYMGVPLHPTKTQEVLVNALPWRAYQQIYNDWYRNENLTGIVTINKGDTLQNITNPTLSNPRVRHKRSDYFTRALPWPQKGDPVLLPLGANADVVTNLEQPSMIIDGGAIRDLVADNDTNAMEYDGAAIGGAPEKPITWFQTGMQADLSSATAASINDIRTAFQIQRLLERDARGGTRYIEILLSHFNVQSPDFRLQRAEFLGGGSARIIVDPVAATVATEDAPQGELAAIGTGLVKGKASHSFTEHGYMIGIISCRSDLTYQHGLDRMWSRETRYDFYWPALSHLGEQAILNKELYMDQTEGDEEIWGYQERYAEYRYQPGRITGLFRSVHPQSLDVWHLAQEFEEGPPPPLNEFFVADVPPIDRVVAVPSEPDLIVDIWHELKATRPMPVYAVPGMVDHF